MIENLNCTVQPKLASDYKQLIKRWNNIPITSQFDIEICEIAMSNEKCIEGFKWHPMPTETSDHKRFRFLTESEQNDFIKKNAAFYEKNIKGFVEAIDRIKMNNQRNRATLIEWTKLNISNELRTKVDLILNTYRRI